MLWRLEYVTCGVEKYGTGIENCERLARLKYEAQWS